jgi:WD40 repeat protein/serine/threonine protein kinase
MATENFKEAGEIFQNAIEIENPAKRKDFLENACKNDRRLRAEVEALLRAHEKAGDFLEDPAHGSDVTLDSSPISEGPGTVIGRYKLLELIGEGGMGLVYLAQQKEPVRRRVALKIVKLGMDTKQVVARFEAERQTLAVLDHPNIAHVLDAGTTEAGRPYFVMEYVRGVSITKYSDERRLNIEQRLRSFEQVCEGIHHAHQKGIIHRDVKPSNILVSIHGDRAVPKIIDFGIAKAITQPLTDKTFVTYQGQLLGTPEYMSPEQVDLAIQDIDTRSDIYSLGVVLYELLAGVLPFEKESFERAGFAEIQQTIRELEPASPSIRLTSMGEKARTIAASRGTQVIALARRLHRELEWIPLKAMRKDRCRRYRSASEMADDVRNYLNGLPLIAGPETAMYIVRKFVRKHAGSVTTVALVAVAIILGFVVSTAMYFRAEDMRVQAEQAREKETMARTRAEQAEEATKQKAEELRRTLYVNSIQLADAKYREGNISRVRELLELCPNDLRSWEWDRLNHIADQSIMTLRGHSDWVSSVAVSPDGRHVVSASWDNKIKVWDVLKSTELLTISREHGNAVTCIALSPDGRRVAAGDNAGQMDVWDVASGKKLMVLKGHNSWVSSLAFGPDGSRIVSGSWDTTTKMWDAVVGTRLTTLMSYTGGISSIAFSPDGKRIASAAYGDDKIKVLDATTTEELMTLGGKSIWDAFVSFSPDNKLIASAQDNDVKIWDSTTGAELMTLHGHEGWVRSFAFSLDSKYIVSGGADNTIKLWDTATGENILTLRGHEGPVSSVAFSSDCKQIISGSNDRTIKLWDVDFERESARFVGHKEKIHSVAFSPDGRRVVSASQDGIVKVWEVESRTEAMSILAGGRPLLSTALSSDGKRIASPNFWDNTIKVWDAATGVETMTLRGHEALIVAVAFSPDNKQLVSGSLDKTIKIWDVATAKEMITLHGHTKTVISVAFSPDGKRIASAGSDGLVLAVLDRVGEIKVWDAVTGTNLITLRQDDLFSRVSFSPDGSKIICGSRDGTIKIRDSVTGAELTTLRGHAEVVTSVAFSPDGKRIVSGSRDRTAKIWDSTTGDELLTLRDYSGLGLNSVTFSPDGKSIAAGTLGAIVLWESTEPTGGYQTRQVSEAARKLVVELYQKEGYYYKVINELQADKTLDEQVRRIALKIANSRSGDDIGKFTTEIIEVVASPDRDIETYQQALKKIEMANQLDLNNPDILTILGMAQYRVGKYQEAMDTLTEAEKIWENMKDPIDASVAFIARAMAAHKLGQDEHKEAALGRLRELRKEEPIAGIKEVQAFLDEAEKLLSGKNQ